MIANLGDKLERVGTVHLSICGQTLIIGPESIELWLKRISNCVRLTLSTNAESRSEPREATLNLRTATERYASTLTPHLYR